MNEKRTTDRHSIARVLIIVALISIAISTFVFLLEAHLESKRDQIEIQKRLDAIHAAGQPVTAQDLAKLYPDPPPEHDAALILKPVFDGLKISDNLTNLPFFEEVELPKRQAPLSTAMKTDMESFLRENAVALAAFPKNGLSNAWIGCGFSGGFTNFGEFPISSVAHVAKAYCIEAVYEADLGEAGKSAQALCRCLALLQALSDGIMIHHVARLGLTDLACDSLERAMNQLQFSETYLAALDKSFTGENPDGLRQALISERCFQIWEMETIRKNPSESIPHDLSDPIWKRKAVSWYAIMSGKAYRDSDFELMLDRIGKRIEAMQLPMKQRLIELKRLKSELNRGRQNTSIALMLVDSANPYPDLASGDAAHIAHLRTAQVALTLERWRLAHNDNLPDSLAELAPDFHPAVPTDPFDDQPLRYKKLAHGYVVYSIGPDFTDDGGKEKPSDAKDTDHYDITFTVER